MGVSSILALAGAERTQRLRSLLPRDVCLEAFAAPEALVEHARAHRAPLGLILAALPPDREAALLFDELARSCPGSARLLWLENEDFQPAAQALRTGGLDGLVGPGADDQELVQALVALVRNGERRALERLEIERMDFAQSVLRDTVSALEQRLDHLPRTQPDAGHLLKRLRDVRDLGSLVRMASRLIAQQFPGCGVRVALNQTVHASAHEAWAGVRSGEVLARVPLRGLEREFGWLEISSGHAHRSQLTPSEMARLAASEPAITLVAAGLIHRDERNGAQLATVHGLARLAEHRDETTGRHLERVSAFCRLLGEHMRAEGLYPELLGDLYIEDLELSAPLHDIGKVAVPDAILLKPGKLTEDEWEVMRSHARVGAQALETILQSSGEQPYLRMGLEIAWCHHEHWDGGGYPRGLRGKEIPLAARIMALADVYDALTSRRPYKEAWSHERTVAYIVGLSGRQFDPDVVRVFAMHARDFEAKRNELSDEVFARSAAA